MASSDRGVEGLQQLTQHWWNGSNMGFGYCCGESLLPKKSLLCRITFQTSRWHPCVQLSSHFCVFLCILVFVFLPQRAAECTGHGGDRVSAAVCEPGCSAQLCPWQTAKGGRRPTVAAPAGPIRRERPWTEERMPYRRVQRCGTDRLVDSNMFSTVSAALCWSLACVYVQIMKVTLCV